MEKRKFGNTNLLVTPLGLGAGHIGDYNTDESIIKQFLNTILDEGTNFIDTARGYGASEERIGKFISHRRKEFVLSTKVGYGIAGYSDWTYEIVLAGINEALRILKTDYIDIVHLHSCPIEILIQGDVIYAIEKAREQGKIISAAYSGENEALHFAVDSGRFNSIETSINIADQRNIDLLLPKTVAKNIGVIAKRPAANAPWRFKHKPSGHYSEIYWERIKSMSLDFGDNWLNTAIRFSAYTEGISTAILGTGNLEHFREAVRAVERGPLTKETYSFIRNAFISKDNGWINQT